VPVPVGAGGDVAVHVGAAGLRGEHAEGGVLEACISAQVPPQRLAIIVELSEEGGTSADPDVTPRAAVGIAKPRAPLATGSNVPGVVHLVVGTPPHDGVAGPALVLHDDVASLRRAGKGEEEGKR